MPKEEQKRFFSFIPRLFIPFLRNNLALKCISTNGTIRSIMFSLNIVCSNDQLLNHEMGEKSVPKIRAILWVVKDRFSLSSSTPFDQQPIHASIQCMYKQAWFKPGFKTLIIRKGHFCRTKWYFSYFCKYVYYSSYCEGAHKSVEKCT